MANRIRQQNEKVKPVRLGLSVRKTQQLVGFVYARQVSSGYIERLTDRVGRRAQGVLNRLSQCRQKAVEHATPTTTNALESKNSVFKPFSRMAKFFSEPKRCEAFFSGVALTENFDIKTRGVHQGSSAIQRAGINWADLVATDFFPAVGLPKPQISPTYVTD